METTTFLLLGVLAVTASLLLITMLRRRAERRRREGFRSLAEAQSWAYVPEEVPFSVGSQIWASELLRMAPRRPAFNVVRGKLLGGELTIFDFAYSPPGSRRILCQTVAGLRVEPPPPVFSLRPREDERRLAPSEAFAEVALEEYPELTRRYMLLGREAGAVRSYFTAERCRAFLGALEQQPWSVESTGDWLLLYRHGRLARASELEAFLFDVARLIGAVWQPATGAQTPAAAAAARQSA